MPVIPKRITNTWLHLAPSVPGIKRLFSDAAGQMIKSIQPIPTSPSPATPTLSNQDQIVRKPTATPSWVSWKHTNLNPYYHMERSVPRLTNIVSQAHVPTPSSRVKDDLAEAPPLKCYNPREKSSTTHEAEQDASDCLLRLHLCLEFFSFFLVILRVPAYDKSVGGLYG